jgi:hypothetical protein
VRGDLRAGAARNMNGRFHRPRFGGGSWPGTVNRDRLAGQKDDRLGHQGPILEIFLVVGGQGGLDVVASQQFGLRAELCHQFGGRVERGVVQAATFFAAIALGSLNKG